MNQNKTELVKAFQNGFESDIHTGRLFVIRYNTLYNQYNVSVRIDTDEFAAMLKEEYKIDQSNVILSYSSASEKKHDKLDKESVQEVVELKPEFLIDYNLYRINFYFAKQEDRLLVDEILSKIKVHKSNEKHKNRFYMIARSRRSELGFELKKFKINKDEINIKDLYNDDFIPVHERILDFVNDKKQKGIVMLHGKYGTGKSTYIRYLMKNSKSRFIFMPNYMAFELSSPDFMPFLANYANSVLVLEDCEDLIRPRSEGNRNDALVNLLNLGDGLLSDALSIKLICTFNADIKKIEPAIMRKGRLAARYEFDALSVEKATALAQKNGLTAEIKQPITLAELFNVEKENFANTTDGKKVGFSFIK
jgi:hypothetical protein